MLLVNLQNIFYGCLCWISHTAFLGFEFWSMQAYLVIALSFKFQLYSRSVLAVIWASTS